MVRPPREVDLELCAKAADVCTAHNLRNATRAVSSVFDEAMRPTGLRVCQSWNHATRIAEAEAKVAGLVERVGWNPRTLS